MEELCSCIDSLSSIYSNLGRTFEKVHNPYLPSYSGNLSYFILLIRSWVDEMHRGRETWFLDSYTYEVVNESKNFCRRAREALSHFQ